MAFRARNRTPACPRCGRPIEVEALIEKSFPGKNGAMHWVHVGCQSASKQLPSSPNVTAAISGLMAKSNARRAVVVDRTAIEDEPETGHISEQAIEEIVLGIMAQEKDAWAQECAAELGVKLKGVVGHLQREIAERVRATIDTLAPAVQSHEFTFGSLAPVRMDGQVLHPNFDRIVRLATARPLHGASLKPLFFPGPTGCGKTHTAYQLWEYLRTQFPGRFKHFGLFSCTAGMTESDLMGSAVPNVTTGENIYQPSALVRCCEEGGVFCLDEMDAGDQNVLLKLNAPLAQHKLYLSKRVDKPEITLHPDLVFIATANTWGTGANRQYVGRNPLDEATLDRFRIGTIACDYVPAVERALCPDVELYSLLSGWRKKLSEFEIKRVISTRFYRDAYEMRCLGDSLDDIRLSLVGGWRKEEQEKVTGL